MKKQEILKRKTAMLKYEMFKEISVELQTIIDLYTKSKPRTKNGVYFKEYKNSIFFNNVEIKMSTKFKESSFKSHFLTFNVNLFNKKGESKIENINFIYDFYTDLIDVKQTAKALTNIMFETKVNYIRSLKG